MNRRLAMAVCAAAMLAMVLPAAQGTGPSSPQVTAKPAGAPIGGTLTPAKADARGWGWQVKAMMNPETPRPLYNRAKERLLQDKQITSYTISSFDPELYCEVGKHFDYIWFEMQHSTMSYDEVRRMILACPRVGAAPMIRMPDALRVEHPEGHRPRRARDHRSHRRRRARGARRGALLPLSTVRTTKRRRRRLSRALERAGHELSRDDQRQHARDGDDRNARRRGDGQRDRGHARRRRRSSWATTICRTFPAGARTILATRTRSSRCTTRRSNTASTTATPASST